MEAMDEAVSFRLHLRKLRTEPQHLASDFAVCGWCV